jgi:hypothetical protein
MPVAETAGRAAGVRPAICRCIAMLAVIAIGVWASPLGAQAPQDARALAEQAIRRLDLQTELRRQPEQLVKELSLPPEAVWLAVVVGVGALLYAFRDMIPILRAGRGGAWADDEDRALATGRRAPETWPRRADSSRPCTSSCSRPWPRSAAGSTSSSPIP